MNSAKITIKLRGREDNAKPNMENKQDHEKSSSFCKPWEIENIKRGYSPYKTNQLIDHKHAIGIETSLDNITPFIKAQNTLLLGESENKSPKIHVLNDKDQPNSKTRKKRAHNKIFENRKSQRNLFRKGSGFLNYKGPPSRQNSQENWKVLAPWSPIGNSRKALLTENSESKIFDQFHGNHQNNLDKEIVNAENPKYDSKKSNELEDLQLDSKKMLLLAKTASSPLAKQKEIRLQENKSTEPPTEVSEPSIKLDNQAVQSTINTQTESQMSEGFSPYEIKRNNRWSNSIKQIKEFKAIQNYGELHKSSISPFKKPLEIKKDNNEYDLETVKTGRKYFLPQISDTKRSTDQDSLYNKQEVVRSRRTKTIGITLNSSDKSTSAEMRAKFFGDQTFESNIMVTAPSYITHSEERNMSRGHKKSKASAKIVKPVQNQNQEEESMEFKNKLVLHSKETFSLMYKRGKNKRRALEVRAEINKIQAEGHVSEIKIKQFSQSPERKNNRYESTKVFREIETNVKTGKAPLLKQIKRQIEILNKNERSISSGKESAFFGELNKKSLPFKNTEKIIGISNEMKDKIFHFKDIVTIPNNSIGKKVTPLFNLGPPNYISQGNLAVFDSKFAKSKQTKK